MRLNYNSLLEQAKAAGTEAARTWIPKLCYALKDEDKDLSKEDIKDRVEKDCVEIWSKSTIRTHIPDEFKDVQKQEAGRKGREKQLEQPIPAGGARETGAENSSFPPIQEESKNLEDINRPNIKSTAQMYGKSQDELKNTKRELKELEAKLEEAKKRIATLQESQNIDDIPELVDNKIGPVEIKNLSKISQFHRRGILAGRFAELIRRKLAAEGRASIKFYVIGKDRTTNIESLVPVSFIVDLKERTTDMILDESSTLAANYIKEHGYFDILLNGISGTYDCLLHSLLPARKVENFRLCRLIIERRHCLYDTINRFRIIFFNIFCYLNRFSTCNRGIHICFSHITKPVQLLSVGNLDCQGDLNLAGRRAQSLMYVVGLCMLLSQNPAIGQF